jgi:hypothetical protein
MSGSFVVGEIRRGVFSWVIFFIILIYTTRVLLICTTSFVFIRHYHICKAEMHCRDVVQNRDSIPIPGILDVWLQIPGFSSFYASWRMEIVRQHDQISIGPNSSEDFPVLWRKDVTSSSIWSQLQNWPYRFSNWGALRAVFHREL